MMMTETEAKRKWCPFGSMVGNGTSYNRTSYDTPVTTCLASDCAAWRWQAAEPEAGQEKKGCCGIARP